MISKHRARLGVLTLFFAATYPALARASSHSEAPGTAKDRLADDTDLYAFVAPDAADRVTLIGNWVPLLEPAGGPNFASFDDEVSYYINIDNVGDCQDHIRYEFKFTTIRRNGNTFLYNTGPVTSLDDPDLNVRQTYTVTRIENGVETVLGSGLPVAPAFVGPTSMPDYASLARAAVQELSDGTQVFVGPRDDPFFVDLAAIFDLLQIRKVPGNKGKGVDDLAGFNVMTIALQIPMTRLTKDGAAPGAGNGIIGVYDSAERMSVRSVDANGVVTLSGEERQVSRLGNPLVNEVVIPLQDKDTFNRTKPSGDAAFLSYVQNPEVGVLLNALYGINVPPNPRGDLVTVFLTGIPGVNQPAGQTAGCDMLRLNITLPPSAAPNRFGVIAGDAAGFPNGRRLIDDVVDVALRVVAGGYVLTPTFNVAPNNQLGDGIDANDMPFLPQFPYAALPHSPFDHEHHREQHGVAIQSNNDRGVHEGPLSFSGANPAPATRLEFTVLKAAQATLKIYDVQGRLVRTLVDQLAAPGTFSASWDGRADDGESMRTGIYFARFAAGDQVGVKKIVLQR
jgi:uncharacterized protein DUF4331/flagellar hook capping protein FlgD